MQLILSQLFGFINSLQLIIHIILVPVVFPANTVTLFSYLIPVIQFDFLEQFEIPHVFFTAEQEFDYDGKSPINIMQ